MKWYFFKTLREKQSIIRKIKKGNPIPFLKYLLYRFHISPMFYLHRKWYTMRVFYSPYAFWLWTHEDKEKDEELFFEKFLKEGDVVVDCGAHLGTLTITASKIVGDKGHVYAYEAHPRTFGFLKKNIHDNGCKNVTSLHVAITDTNQSVRFSDYYVNDMNSIEENGPLVVEGKNLEFLLCDVERVDLLKLDIEGGELQALKGAGDILKRTKAVYFESAARSFARFGYSLDDIVAFLKESGFVCYLLSNGNISCELQLGHVTKMKYENILALQK